VTKAWLTMAKRPGGSSYAFCYLTRCRQGLEAGSQTAHGLATLLLDSLEPDVEVEKKLLRELTKRAAELRSGKVKGMTTQEAYGFSL
jgi:hypothetical protein